MPDSCQSEVAKAAQLGKSVRTEGAGVTHCGARGWSGEGDGSVSLNHRPPGAHLNYPYGLGWEVSELLSLELYG